MKHLAIVRLLVPAVFLVCGAAQNEPAPSLPDLMKQAQAGDAGAQAELGRDYEDGKGVPQNDELAAEWYRKSAEQGNAVAQNSLGSLYWRGRGVVRDKAEAFRWYKRAAKQGLPEGAYNVAISYYNREGVEGDLRLAYVWMSIARDEGDAEAGEAIKHIEAELEGYLTPGKMELAELYENGEEIAPNLGAAAKLYMDIARQENRYTGTAQYKLCQFYLDGKAFAQDYTEARLWCRKAAKRGMSLAYVPLGNMAEQGLGTAKDLKEAADWYRDAAVRDLPDGYMRLAALKLQGGSMNELEEAYSWFYVANLKKVAGASAGMKAAGAHLAEKEIAKAQKKALEWLHLKRWEKIGQLKVH
jgi:TPR repeat protein